MFIASDPLFVFEYSYASFYFLCSVMNIAKSNCSFHTP